MDCLGEPIFGYLVCLKYFLFIQSSPDDMTPDNMMFAKYDSFFVTAKDLLKLKLIG